MQVSFALGSDPDEQTTLDHLAAHAAAADDGLLEGRLILEDGGATPVVLEDDLQFLVPGLCLDMPPRLAADGTATVRMASMPVQTIFQRDGNSVRLTDGDGVALGRFPHDALVEALHDCAGRFTAFIGELAALQPAWAKLHMFLMGTK